MQIKNNRLNSFNGIKTFVVYIYVLFYFFLDWTCLDYGWFFFAFALLIK